MTTIEQHADAILRAAGSALRHYTMPPTRAAILAAVQAVHDAGREAGWQSFGEVMVEQLGPNGPLAHKDPQS